MAVIMWAATCQQQGRQARLHAFRVGWGDGFVAASGCHRRLHRAWLVAVQNIAACTAQRSATLTAMFAMTMGQAGASSKPSSTSPGTELPSAAYLRPSRGAKQAS